MYFASHASHFLKLHISDSLTKHTQRLEIERLRQTWTKGDFDTNQRNNEKFKKLQPRRKITPGYADRLVVGSTSTETKTEPKPRNNISLQFTQACIR